MSIAFRDSERSTVGLEWEVQIVDPKTLKLGHNAKWILAEVRRRGCSLVKGEMHQNMLEFVSSKRVSVSVPKRSLPQISILYETLMVW